MLGIDLNSLGSVTIILAICAGLCVFGMLLLFLVQIIGGAFEVIGGFLEIIFGILSGGPEAWCSCIIGTTILFLCCGTVITVVGILSTCGTPDAVNFCRLF